MPKVVFFTFTTKKGCFAHVLLNALDMNKRGYNVKIVIEGRSVNLVEEFGFKKHPYHKLWEECKSKGLIDCVCEACAAKFKATDAVKAQGLKLEGSMSGHPSMADYIVKGFTVITV